MSVADTGLRTATVHLGGLVGSSGVGVGVISAGHFAYTSWDWLAQSFELGLGFHWQIIGPLRLYAASGWIIQARSTLTGGGRILAGLAAQFGGPIYVRPGFGTSLAIIGSEKSDFFSLPIEASVETGYVWPFFTVYGRLSAGYDPLLKPPAAVRAEASLGVSVPLGK